MESTGFTDTDLAKYPFLKQTSDRVKKLELTIETIFSPENASILERAEDRVTNSISHVSVGKKSRDNIEILSFPIAIILVIATENAYIKKRYALAEAKQASSDLAVESKERILKVAQDFDWEIKLSPKENSDSPLEFTVNFADYLRNAAHFHDKKWKLSNSILSNGNIYLNKKDVARLLEEEIRRRVEKRLDVKLPVVPPELAVMVDRVKKLAAEKLEQTETEEFSKVVTQSAFPPCINALYADAAASHQLSHIGRFTLTSFMVNIGMTPESLNDLFKTFSDYNERLTRYQIEHIAGERGSGTRYTCPQCSVLQTHGVCKNKDELCRRIYHPLGYYKRKQKLAQKPE